MLAYLITPFFSKARTAASVGSFLTLFMSLVFLAVNYSTFSNAGVAAVSLLSPTAFAFVISKVGSSKPLLIFLLPNIEN